MFKLLEGTKILDLTRLLPGGYCTQLLADMGAEVLKVEDLQQGDYIRTMGPLLKGGESAYFCALNRNKKSICINLKETDGQEILKQLVEKFDILVESFRPGVMDKLGLGYENLSKKNPGLIYCSITGYGQDGPYRQKPGHDINYISIAGALGLTGKNCEGPFMPAVQVADIGGGGLMAAIGILAAIIKRQKSGQGQYIDVGMLDGVVSWLTLYFSHFFAGGGKPERGKMPLNGGEACYNVYMTKEGRYISLGAIETKFWEEFCRLSGRVDLRARQHSETKEDFEAIQELFSTMTRDEIIKVFGQSDTCIEPVLELDEVIEHPQVVHRRLFKEMKLSDGQSFKTVASPLKFPVEEEYADEAPPKLGFHTAEMLKSLGFNELKIEELVEHGIVR